MNSSVLSNEVNDAKHDIPNDLVVQSHGLKWLQGVPSEIFKVSGIAEEFLGILFQNCRKFLTR